MKYNFKLRYDAKECVVPKTHLFIHSCSEGPKSSKIGHGPQLLKIWSGGLEYWYGIYYYGSKEYPDIYPEGNLKITGVDIYDQA
jgi:hypothetical protein